MTITEKYINIPIRCLTCIFLFRFLENHCQDNTKCIYSNIFERSSYPEYLEKNKKLRKE